MSKFVLADGRVIHPQTSLTREQKEAVGLLSIGTFLEYFDLMLYVHMAVLLNELFFPKTEPYTAKLLAAAAFCSTYLMRPFGTLIFGWIGDTIGRKATVVITTSMMALSCIVMASLPTYSQIGITATWIVTICRIIQGMSSMGEAVGAELYITEMIPPPRRYPAVALIVVVGTLGGSTALGVASMMTSFDFNWRIAFLIGACIAIIGAVARSSLRETTDFVNAKKRIQNIVKTANLDITTLKSHIVWKEQVSTKTIIAYFLIELKQLRFNLTFDKINKLLNGG
jgi:MFS family permease